MGVNHLTVPQVAALLTEDRISEQLLSSLRNDSRISVLRLLQKWEHRQFAARKEQERVQKLYHHEQRLSAQGHHLIAGVDEAGRGPLAGPVVVAAAILPVGCHLPKLNDSKKLSPKQRFELYTDIKRVAIATAHIVVGVEEIDALNIYQATVGGMYAAIAALQPVPQAVLIDAVPLPRLRQPSLSLIGGDALSASIAAASIIAKVERDLMMNKMDEQFPGYGFAAHKGYGTAEHLKAIRLYGPCSIHRRSFEPIKSWEEKT